MATGKRFYWIKLKDTFFTSDTVDFFMSQPNGANYVVLYQMLCLRTANTGGRLSRQIGEIIIPYDIAKITRDCKWFSEDTVRVALELYKKFGLVYEDTDGTLVMSDHNSLVGSETDYAYQKQAQRVRDRMEKEQALLSDGNNVDSVHTDVHDDVCKNVHTDIRYKRLDIRDKDIDIKDKEKNIKKKAKTKTDYSDEFETFWKTYPRPDGKLAAYKAWKARLNEGYTEEQMINGSKAYALQTSRKHTSNEYIKMPATFLGPNLWFLEIIEKSADRSDSSMEDDTDRIMQEYFNGV